MIEVKFTTGEAAALQELLHVAVQARGLQVAEAAVVLSRKLTEAQKAAHEPPAAAEKGDN